MKRLFQINRGPVEFRPNIVNLHEVEVDERGEVSEAALTALAQENGWTDAYIYAVPVVAHTKV